MQVLSRSGFRRRRTETSAAKAKEDQFWILRYGFTLLVLSFAIVACGETTATLENAGRPRESGHFLTVVIGYEGVGC
jgi:hypothetical protein